VGPFFAILRAMWFATVLPYFLVVRVRPSLLPSPQIGHFS